MFGGKKKLFGSGPKGKSSEPLNSPIIAVYAHKGGVGKTTNVIQMAHYMAQEMHKKVMLVDADPQCTLSQAVCEEAGQNPEWRAKSEGGDLQSAWEAAYLAACTGTRIPSAELVKIDRSEIFDNSRGDVFLLPGSLETFKLERALAYAQDLNNRDWLNDIKNFAELKEGMGVFRKMIHSTVWAHNIDFVFVDCGPAICDLNMNILCSSDFFVIPAMADRYSKSSLATISRVLSQWAADQAKLVELGQDMKCPLKATPPKFCGVLFSRVPYSSQGKPVHVNAYWMEQCQEVIKNLLYPALQEANMLAPKIGELADDGFTLEQIPQFTKCFEMSMRCRSGVFNMPWDMVFDVDNKGETVQVKGKQLDDVLHKAESYKEFYKNLCARLLQIMSQLFEDDM